MPLNVIRDRAKSLGARVEIEKNGSLLRISVDRAVWFKFFTEIFKEESIEPSVLRMLGGKKIRVGVEIFVEIFLPTSGDHFVVSTELSMVDTLPSLKAMWPYAEFMEQEVRENCGARIETGEGALLNA